MEYDNIRPRVFIGSSSEGLNVAQGIQVNLDRKAEVSLWTTAFPLSAYTFDSLVRAFDINDYGIFVLTPDDMVESRESSFFAPRDNVIFELGLCAGKLGIEHTFIVHPRDLQLKIPTDLLGITTASYQIHSSNNYASMVGAACSQISFKIDNTYKKGVMRNDWNTINEMICQISMKLSESPALGGFVPDIFLGISRGGIIIADLLSIKLGGRIPVLCLWADRYIEYPKTVFSSPSNNLNSHILDLLKRDEIRNILLVDDMNITGNTLNNAKAFLSDNLDNKTIKAAVMITNTDQVQKLDFYALATDTKKLAPPF